MTDKESGSDNTSDGQEKNLKPIITLMGVTPRNLMIAPNVKTTASIERTIALLDPYFVDLTSVVTSGLRTPEDQLGIIIEKAERHGISKLFSEFVEHKGKPYAFKCNVEGEHLYWWQQAWSKLLEIQEIVNPPTKAECLFNYFRPGSKVNKKGRVIDISNHMRGLSFDIGGGTDLDERYRLVHQAAQDGKCFIRDYLKEVVNNAVHLDLVPID